MRASAEPPQAVRAADGLLETLMLNGDYRQGAGLAERFLPLLKEVGDSADVVKVNYYYALSLVQRFELRAGHDRMREALEIAERIGDGRARAYARAGLLHCRTRLGLDSLEAAEAAKAELMRDAQEFGDNFVRNAAYFAATWDYFYRGLVNEARAMAIRLIASGEERADPRAIGFANWMLGWIQIVCGAPDAAIGYAEECAELATTPFDRLQGEIIRAVALVLSGDAAEGLAKMDRLNREFERLGALYSVLGAPRGAALVALGRIAEGISVIERSIAERDAAGDLTLAAFARVLLAEIQIEIVVGGRKAPFAQVAKNLPTLIAVKLGGARRARKLLEEAMRSPNLSPTGVVAARVGYNLGRLSERSGQREEAQAHYSQARAIAELQGLNLLRNDCERALARLAAAGAPSPGAAADRSGKIEGA